ncbi:hypothetical protein HN51_010518 [Arachis hypogaea]|uniref:Jasmonate O-methyltransferase n=1 Tax=Arachis hypogaea TaxID=3818 RepID=A0A445E2W9_ARAHY|nr:3,7-dimethylxanthine N-methyltransferase [Arachis hypogaea]QHO55614.1 putative caffeine synthase [Arachis hypogaea]RYR69761.1 hypothetical protein Ahy_A03g016313 [Arachis hypogaea]
MATEQVLHMNGGTGETSYANNSMFQKNAILRTKHIMEECIIKLYRSTSPECLKVADLGCSSGPNTLMVASTTVKVVDAMSQTLNQDPPMYQFFLNDLYGNDFNNIFKSVPDFYKRMEEEIGHKFGPCFISGTPGTFYGRLFPNHSIHFFHSSSTLHWLSQIPKELNSEVEKPMNKGAICLTKASPPGVHKAYSEQFQRDLKVFLRSRSEELIPGGAMVLSMIILDQNHNTINGWEVIGAILNNMVSEHKVEKRKLDSYNISSYFPTAEEVRQVIEEEGSFNIQRMEKIIYDIVESVMETSNDNSFIHEDEDAIGERQARTIRAVSEPILKAEFGEEIMDELFTRFKSKTIQLNRVKKLKGATLVAYMTKDT